jgi:hypothetical protein
MNDLQIHVADGAATFRPGEEVRGTASWSLEEDPKSVELRLFWRTEGKGTQDVGVAETVRFEGAGQQDRRDFHLRLPPAPYSFSGKLVSLVWALEVVAEPGSFAGRQDIVVSPTGREIVLGGK